MSRRNGTFRVISSERQERAARCHDHRTARPHGAIDLLGNPAVPGRLLQDLRGRIRECTDQCKPDNMFQGSLLAGLTRNCVGREKVGRPQEAIFQQPLVHPVSTSRSEFWLAFADTRSFIREDENYNYISGRFPPDAKLLAEKTIALVNKTVA